MESIDKRAEQQVWQRVLSHPETPRGDLRALELAALEGATVYRKLMSHAALGKSRPLLRRLYENQMETAACLRGIRRLSGGAQGKTPNISIPEEPAAKALEKRYHCARRALTEYTARTVDGDFGSVYQHLADRERETCWIIARVLGELGV